MDKLICIGKNYLNHAKELGDALPENPVVFLKPPSVLISASQAGQKLEAKLPVGQGQVHHECEVVVRIKRGGYRLRLEQAMQEIDAWTLGLDMTLRDVQAVLKKNGHPWEVSKVFPGSAMIGPWNRPNELKADQEFSFEINGKIRQKDKVQSMRLSPAQCISYASQFFELCSGDLLFTGTPAGVGPVSPGERGVVKLGSTILFEASWK